MSTYQHHRAYYRVEYPQAVRPEFFPAGHNRTAPVVDCCERGFRFDASGATVATVTEGHTVAGELRFRDGETIPVTGVVVRVQAGEVAVHLDRDPIPFKRILHEQMFLRRRYPYGDQRAVA